MSSRISISKLKGWWEKAFNFSTPDQKRIQLLVIPFTYGFTQSANVALRYDLHLYSFNKSSALFFILKSFFVKTSAWWNSIACFSKLWTVLYFSWHCLLNGKGKNEFGVIFSFGLSVSRINIQLYFLKAGPMFFH